MGPRGGILYATLSGGVRIRERTTERMMSGQSARIIVSSNVVQVWGNPVVLQEAGGNQVSGELITWERGTNSVLVQGSEDTPAETIFQPASGTPTPGARPDGEQRRRP